MDHKDTARMLKALGDPTRLSIFQFLRTCCCATIAEGGEVRAWDGPTITEVCGHVMGDKKITTSMSFHLKELRNAGLIQTEKRGKNVCCCVDRTALEALSAYFQDEPIPGGGCC